MTRQSLPDICDSCGVEITGEAYSVQYAKKNQGKGNFVKCSNSADQCHACFLEVCKNGFKPKWIHLVKNDISGKWEEHEAQQKL